MDPAAIIQLITLAEPLIGNLVLFIKDKTTGTMSAIAILDSVDMQVQKNQDALNAYLATKQSSSAAKI